LGTDKYLNRKTSTHLDTGKTEQTSLLRLEPLVDLVGVIAVHFGLLHQREGDAMVERAELLDASVIFWFLPTELQV